MLRPDPGRTLFALVMLLGVCSLAIGQDEPESTGEEVESVRLPELVVTARKRIEEDIDVPQSVTTVPESAIRDAGIRRVRDALIYVPNANIVEFTARRLSFPFVRGIGSGQGEPAVATYLDGVPLLSGSMTNLPIVNVDRIEFLRGPQGTLYGRNSLGGLIHVFTRRPPREPELGAVLTVGNHGLHEGRLVVGAPLIADRLSASLAGLVTRRDGYTTNDFTGHEVDDRDTIYGQGQLLFTPDERNEFRLSLHADRTRDGGFALSDLEGLRDRPYRISQDFEGVTERDAYVGSLGWRHSGDAVELVSVTSLQGFDVLETSDFDFSELDGVRRTTEEESGSFVQEFRVASADDAPIVLGPDAELRWLVGFLAFWSDSERSAANDYRPGGVGTITPMAGVDDSSGDFRDRGIGLFGHATVTVFEDFEIGAGLRYDYESTDADLSRSFTSSGNVLSSQTQEESESYDELLPRFELGYRVSEEVRVYAFAAKGFKAGGFNLDAPSGQLAYAPETNWTYEIGVKTLLLDGGLRLNAALFWIDWDDMQLSQFDAQVGGYVTNAGEATSRGIELEAAARPVEDLEVFATFGLTDTEFDSYVDPYGEDVRGNDLPFAPDLTTSLGAQWAFDLGGGVRCHLRGEYGYLGTFYYDAGNRESESIGLLNLRLGVGGEQWRVETWVRNALDTEYVPVAFQPNPGDPSAFVGESGAPRTFGLTFNLDI